MHFPYLSSRPTPNSLPLFLRPAFGVVVLLGCIPWLNGAVCELPSAPAAQATTGIVKTQPSKKMIPWIEVNNPSMRMKEVDPTASGDRGEQTLYEHGLEGLLIWKEPVDTAIVTTRPGQSDALYAKLMRQKPASLRIIGGLKTYGLPGATPDDPKPYDYADAAGWKRILEEARRIVALTETKIVVLENETALTPFHTAKATIDLEKLRASLQPLRESGIQFWWWLPMILADNPAMPDRQAKTTALVKTIAEAVPDSVFLIAYAGWHDWERNTGEVERRRLMSELVGRDHTMEMLYSTVDGYVHYSATRKKQCHTVAESLALLKSLSGEAVVIYPGAANWAATAWEFHRQITKAISETSP